MRVTDAIKDQGNAQEGCYVSSTKGKSRNLNKKSVKKKIWTREYWGKGRAKSLP